MLAFHQPACCLPDSSREGGGGALSVLSPEAREQFVTEGMNSAFIYLLSEQNPVFPAASAAPGLSL